MIPFLSIWAGRKNPGWLVGNQRNVIIVERKRQAFAFSFHKCFLARPTGKERRGLQVLLQAEQRCLFRFRKKILSNAAEFYIGSQLFNIDAYCPSQREREQSHRAGMRYVEHEA